MDKPMLVRLIEEHTHLNTHDADELADSLLASDVDLDHYSLDEVISIVQYASIEPE